MPRRPASTTVDSQFASNGRGFASVPVRLRVFGVQMPARDDPAAFRTLFLIQPQTYVAAVLRGSGIEPQSGGWASRTASTPSSPTTASARGTGASARRGPTATRTAPAGGGPPQRAWPPRARTRSLRCAFRSARSDRRAPAPASRRGGRETWTAYLSDRVLPFWRDRGWLDRALVWGWDEPGPVYGRRYAAPQACAAHAAGVAYLTTGAPAQRIRPGACRSRGARARAASRFRAHGTGNGFLWDDRGCDDVDIWAVLSRRVYGSFATPVEHRAHIDTSSASCGPRSDLARARGASIWSFTYESAAGRVSPGTRRPSPPRMLGCSGCGTPSRAWTERCTPTAWRATERAIRTSP